MRPLSVLPLARPRPGKCFAVAAIPFRLQAADEAPGHLGVPGARVRKGARAEEVARRAGRVDDRCEVDVDPDGAKCHRRSGGLRLCNGRARHLVGCLRRRRPGEPPDDPAFLVDRDQERLAACTGRVLELGRHRGRGMAREPAVAEEHDAAHLAVANPRQEPRIRRRREHPHHRLGGVGEACGPAPKGGVPGVGVAAGVAVTAGVGVAEGWDDCSGSSTR